MSEDLDFACHCGTVKGVIHNAGPSNGDRVVCHCTNCQQFAHYCGAEDRMLDANGGTDLYQTRCGRVEIRQGREKLACIHLTDRPTLRWYASCCRTPMFNTWATGKIPYVTTLAANCDADRRDGVLGEPRGHLFLDEATGDTTGLRAMSMNSMMLSFLPRMVKDLLSGDRRRSPLFDPETLQPVAHPHRLGEAERRDLMLKDN